MEMSGLVPDRDRILEVAMVVTDSELNAIAEAPVYVVHQADEVLEAMRSTPEGAGSEVIGRVVEDHPGVVVARTRFGSTRVVDRPLGEQLLRIC